MKYETIIAFLDGKPDSVGDILTDNFTIPVNPVLVTNEFNGPPIGTATIKREGKYLLAEIDIDPSDIPPEIVESFSAVIGGSITSRNGVSIDGWILRDIGLTDKPCDKRLPRLKRK